MVVAVAESDSFELGVGDESLLVFLKEDELFEVLLFVD